MEGLKGAGGVKKGGGCRTRWKEVGNKVEGVEGVEGRRFEESEGEQAWIYRAR